MSTNGPPGITHESKCLPMKDLNIDNITENTVIVNSQGDDARLTYVMERLVTHLHDFARETRLSTEEWIAALNFLVRVGQISSDVRHVCSPFNSSPPQEEPKRKANSILYRNSSCCPIFSACHSWLMQSTTQNPPRPLKAAYWDHSTHTKQKQCLTGRTYLQIRKANLV